jgi:hypothetical protein
MNACNGSDPFMHEVVLEDSLAQVWCLLGYTRPGRGRLPCL